MIPRCSEVSVMTGWIKLSANFASLLCHFCQVLVLWILQFYSTPSYTFTVEESYCKPTCWSSCLWARECLGWAGRSQARGDELSDPSVWAASRKSSEEGAWSLVWRSPLAGLSPPSPIISKDLIYNTITTKHSSVFNAGIYSNISRLFLILPPPAGFHPFTARGMWTGGSVTGYWTWPPPTHL